MYWQEEIETLNRAQLEALQLKRLQETVARVAACVPHYQQEFARRSFRPDALRSLSDVRRLPFTTSADLRAAYPAGLLAVPLDNTLRLHTSSGTTGKPKAIFFSRQDIENAAELCARSFVMTGVTRQDVFQNMMTYGLFTGALMTHYGAEKVGCLVIPAGPGNSERQLMLMKDFRTTVVHVTPSYALYFADFLEKKGIEPRRDLALRRAFVGAEPYTEETRLKIEEGLQLSVFNSYGLSEMNGPGIAFECEQRQGMHVWEDHFLIEIIDPATGEPLPDGETGELVMTTLCREAMPLLRYRTRDITSVIPEPCACGRTHRRLNRIKGRSDDMLIVRGVNIYPQQIERVLMSIRGIGRNYLIRLDGLDEMTVQVELAAGGFNGEFEQLMSLQTRIAERLRAEILIKPRVELVQPATLPVAEGKAKRVVDNRRL
ncbi:MAG TPA: phenylacetate--CoA ligase [Verrucomicrobia bacterium]|nr:phenylacetate--CoA ligase [Verrucomicrobiota bacterium]HOB32166.1 phenylacetate--CoA ligase [Verrucomicrobiota bacterium]HOP97062.1 phenylacetate--CoA ligase [Verrucomicrobiota bacterium]